MTSGLVSIIIPSWNKAGYISNLVDSIKNRTSYINYEIIIIDASYKNSRKVHESACVTTLLQQIKGIKIIRKDGPLEFSVACHEGIIASKGEYILLLNHDTLIPSDSRRWLTELVNFLDYGFCSSVTPMSKRFNNTVYWIGANTDAVHCNFSKKWEPQNLISRPKEVWYNNMACMLSYREFFKIVPMCEVPESRRYYGSDSWWSRTILHRIKLKPYCIPYSWIWHFNFDNVHGNVDGYTYKPILQKLN